MTTIQYGLGDTWLDCTAALSRNAYNGLVHIPLGDCTRYRLIGSDPIVGTEKVIKISGVSSEIILSAHETAWIDLASGAIAANPDCHDINSIHQGYELVAGNKTTEELPEQQMIARFLVGDEKVLELGGNVGRATAVIAEIQRRAGLGGTLVTFEPLSQEAETLIALRDANGFKYDVMNAALSEYRIIRRGWITKVVPDDYIAEAPWTDVSAMRFNEYISKYGYPTTVVADCEGALFSILSDTPDLFRDVTKLFIENDFPDPANAEWVWGFLRNEGFVPVYTEPLVGNGNAFPYTRDVFFQAWMKV